MYILQHVAILMLVARHKQRPHLAVFLLDLLVLLVEEHCIYDVLG